MNAGLVVIILLVGLSILGIPIFLSLGIATAIGVQMLGLPFVMIPQKMFTGMDSSALMAIPFFILAGNIMSRSITGKLINVSDALIGWIKGSLGIVTVLASALFGAISGSAVATVSAVGGITIPAMKKQGYGAPFASAVASMHPSGPLGASLHHPDRLRQHYRDLGLQALYFLRDPGTDFGDFPDRLHALVW